MIETPPNAPVIADPRPPRRGRRRAGLVGIEMIEAVEVDAALVEMAAPQRPKQPRRQQQTDFYEVTIFEFSTNIYMFKNRSSIKPARNLDWIIDAVARGVTVDNASPHNRRKPEVHICTYCGKMDKYPSKIKVNQSITRLYSSFLFNL